MSLAQGLIVGGIVLLVIAGIMIVISIGAIIFLIVYLSKKK